MNDESTIGNTLESIASLNSQILVADLGCTDKTISICKKYKCKIEKMHFDNDFSLIRNNLMNLSNTKWNLFLDPWETFLAGKDVISKLIAKEACAFKFNIIQGDMITKSIRLWHKDTKLVFNNPVFETLVGEFPSQNLDVYISSNNKKNINLNLKIAKHWQEKHPLSSDPIYYLACAYLTEKNWNSFLNFADLYLHQEKSENMSVFMTHYYCSMVNCYVKNKYQDSAKHILRCIIKRPTMAEFWCLLADIYYKTKDYKRAKTFYENAILVGSKRLKNDGWPLEISKYKEYPLKMIEACDKINESSRLYSSNLHNP
jgi:tetratricopeptide (TPR) repeat protein